MEKIKIIFMGTPEIACLSLKSLAASPRIDIVCVLTQEDKKTGRDQILTPTPVKKTALELNLKVLQPSSLKNNTELRNELSELNPDFFVVIAYGQILPKSFLEIPKLYPINIHGSILPKYRGASPIESCLLAGDKETGISIMKMEQSMDTGPVFFTHTINISDKDNQSTLRNRLAELSASKITEDLIKIYEDKLVPVKQDEENATYCKKIEKNKGEIDLLLENSTEIFNKFRAFYNWPGTFLKHKNKIVKLIEIENLPKEKSTAGEIEISNSLILLHCKTGKIVIKQLQIEGKKNQDTKTFLNGNQTFFNK